MSLSQNKKVLFAKILQMSKTSRPEPRFEAKVRQRAHKMIGKSFWTKTKPTLTRLHTWFQ
jgi:hypothetical protein